MTDLLDEPLLTADDVARLLAIPRSAVYRIDEDELPRLKVGSRRTRFRRSDVLRFVRGEPARPDDDPSVRALVDDLEEVVELTLRDVLDERDAERVFAVLGAAWTAVLEGEDPPSD